MRNAFVHTLREAVEGQPDLLLITGDLGYGVLTDFQTQFPEHFLNVGICEQNMSAVAAGAALEGKKVFTYSIANFPTLRCLEQIRNDIAYHDLDVTIVAVGGGFAYGALGMSHHATEDIAILRALPNMTVFTPCDPQETRLVARLALSMPSPCYIRLGKGGEPELHTQPFTLALGKALTLREGAEVALCCAGSIAGEALKAAEQLATEDISCGVYSFPTVKPIDVNLIHTLAASAKLLVTIEEHNIVGGFGGAVSELLSVLDSHAPLVRLGLQDVYSSAVGSQAYLRSFYHIDAQSIAQKVRTRL